MTNDTRLWNLVQMTATEAADRLQGIEEDVAFYHPEEIELRHLDKLQKQLGQAEDCVKSMRLHVARLQNIRTLEVNRVEEVA